MFGTKITALPDLMGSFCPAAFLTGTISAAVRWPLELRSWKRFADLPTTGDQSSGRVTDSRFYARQESCLGALLINEDQKFVCRMVTLSKVASSQWTAGVAGLLRVPVAHGEGRYICAPDLLAELEAEGRVAFRYVDEFGVASATANPNGSMNNIAGVTNSRGNVLGLMPHPERATKRSLGSEDGIQILKAFARALVA